MNPPTCAQCNLNPAACVGRYDNMNEPAPACMVCCGHGNEDGYCVLLDAKVTVEPTANPNASPVFVPLNLYEIGLLEGIIRKYLVDPEIGPSDAAPYLDHILHMFGRIQADPTEVLLDALETQVISKMMARSLPVDPAFAKATPGKDEPAQLEKEVCDRCGAETTNQRKQGKPLFCLSCTVHDRDCESCALAARLRSVGEFASCSKHPKDPSPRG